MKLHLSAKIIDLAVDRDKSKMRAFPGSDVFLKSTCIEAFAVIAYRAAYSLILYPLDANIKLRGFGMLQHIMDKLADHSEKIGLEQGGRRFSRPIVI
ncbi:hypothetical protein ABD76_14650 [Paenibacillus dendritiformis]|nr:hypothetical protein [Paenibacillus dendritiformis]